jgi:hypothetical protein
MDGAQSQSRQLMANLPFQISVLLIEPAPRVSRGLTIPLNFVGSMKANGYDPDVAIMPIG